MKFSKFGTAPAIKKASSFCLHTRKTTKPPPGGFSRFWLLIKAQLRRCCKKAKPSCIGIHFGLGFFLRLALGPFSAARKWLLRRCCKTSAWVLLGSQKVPVCQKKTPPAKLGAFICRLLNSAIFRTQRPWRPMLRAWRSDAGRRILLLSQLA